MAILNYTTSIAAEKTISEIQSMLVRAKADAIMCEYENGLAARLTFCINSPQGILHYRLPANINGVLAAMKRDRKVPRNKCTTEQATRVSWRIVKDWVEAQLAIIEAEIATLAQVFLPYAQTNNGETVYERFQSQGLQALTHQPTPARSGE